MKRRLSLVFVAFFALLTVNILFAQTVVNLSGSTPQLTAVDPYANAANSADGLKPYRPFWYSVDYKGLTILRIEDNTVVYYIPWPQTISVVQPSGEFVEVPAPASGWEPVAMTVTYPTEEALASNSETPPTFVYVVMAHSGFEWQSEINLPAGRDPHVRDKLVATTNSATESSMLVSVDVTDPTFDPGGESATGPMIAGAILGHGAGQPAYDPSTDLLYIGNMPSASLPADLQSFVSVIAAMAPPVAEPAGAGPPVPEPPLVNLCGPEHPDEGLLVGEPYVWACTESGDGPAVWEFQNLPPWLMAHQDKVTLQLDGLVYGTPTANGTWIFQARVTDYGDPEMGPLTSDWYTVTVNVIPTGVASEAEAGFEAGVPGGQGIGGTGDCTPAATSTPGSMVSNWIDVQPAIVSGVVKGCYVMGTAPISGEYYEFALPNFRFNAPFNYEPVILSGNVAGPYVFDPLPAGVSLSGLAWHQIEKIHDPSTEADILNVEFIGVEPITGQLYRILPPQGSLEVSGQVAPPEVSVETDKITTEGQPLLDQLKTLRTDISAQLTGNRIVAFGDVVVEADRDIFVTAPWILDPVDSTFIPIGGPDGSTIENGALIKVSSATISTIDLEKVQAHYLGLDSNLAPAIPGVEPGQKDNGFLWVTGTNTGNVTVVDTAAGTAAPPQAVSGATSLGGVSVDTGIGSAYVAGLSLANVTIFGTGTRPSRSPVIWSGELTTFNIGVPSSFSVMATGLPTPTLSYSGKLPDGVAFTDNGSGTATLAGTPTGPQGDYSFTITAANGISPDATQAFILTIAGPPVFTSANTTTFTVGTAGSFLVTTSGAPSATVQWCTNGIDPAGPCTMPGWLTFMDNEDGTSTLGGTPPAGSEGTYTFYFWATTGVPPDASQLFTLIVNAGSGGSTAPVITSASSTTFNVGEPGSFQFTATGSPAPALSETGALPSGVIFVDNHNGTAALAGVPAVGTQGTYSLTITAANGVLPNATQAFTLTVNSPQTAPVFTSANTTNFTVGSAGSFTVTATGSPTPTLTMAGAPNWLSLTDNHNGTATLAGTPTAPGSHSFTITAANGVSPNATQNFTLTVNGIAPAITSGNTTTFTVGSAGSFTVTASGSPTPALSYWGTLPSGVTFTDNGNGTATLAGTSATAGSYPFTITAANGVSPNATQNFTLTVAGIAPAITSGNSTSFTVGSAGSFIVTATGSPTPQLIAQGPLPSGVTFKDNGNGTATLAGTPAAGTGGSYPLIITAANGVSPNATQNFTLTVNAPRTAPVITSASSTSFTVGSAGSFTVTTTGSLPMTLSETGALPSGVTFADRGNGTATLAGTPAAGTAGSYPFTIRASNGVSPDATQNFTLTVNPLAQPLTIVAPAGNVLPNGTAGQQYSYQLQAQGGTHPYTWSVTGRLPSGLSLSRTGLISGRAGNNSAGNYSFTVRVTDSAAQSASQSLTLTINARPRR